MYIHINNFEITKKDYVTIIINFIIPNGFFW